MTSYTGITRAPARPDPVLYYIRHDDIPEPGSTTFAYPLEALLRTLTEVERQDYGLARVTYGADSTSTVTAGFMGNPVEWTAERWEPDPDGESAHITDDGGVVRRGWLLSDFLATAITMSWRTPDTRGPWRKRATRPEERFAAGLWDVAPDEPEDELRRRMDDVEWDEDAEAVLARKVYDREPVPGHLRSHRFDVTAWQPLPTLTPAAEVYDDRRGWNVDDTSLLAIYGPWTSHLWPGRLVGLRAAVVEALRAHPQIANGHNATVYDHAAREGKISVSYHWYWERPVAQTRYETKGRGRNERRVAREHTSTVGRLRHIERTGVPDAVAGDNYADALDRWQACVIDQRRQFLPDDDEILGCAACGAQGWRTKTDAGTDRDVVRLAADLDELLRPAEQYVSQTTVEVDIARLRELVDAVLGEPVYAGGEG